MDDLQGWFREGLVAGLHALEESRRALARGEAGADESITRLARLLQGSAAEHGLEEVGAAAGSLVTGGPRDPILVEGLMSALERATAAAVARSRTRVLLVEDDPVAARVFRATLEDGHRHVVVAPTAARARE